jgi:hypothetical protein
MDKSYGIQRVKTANVFRGTATPRAQSKDDFWWDENTTPALLKQCTTVPSTWQAVFDVSQGTWTPAITFATPGDLAVTYSTQLGWWHRTGKKYEFSGNITTSAFTHTTASGEFRITGLTVTSSNTANRVIVGPCAWRGITYAVARDDTSCEIQANVNYLRLFGSASGATIDTVDAADVPTGGTIQLRFSISFLVD